MLDEQAQAEVNAASRTLSVIVLGLSAGVIAFGAYVLFLFVPNQERESGLLTPLSFGFSIIQLTLSFFVPRMILNANRKRLAAGTWQAPAKNSPGPQTDAGKLAGIHQTTTIVSGALLESAAFFALFAYMIEGHFASLVGAGVMLAGILSTFPFPERQTHWVRHELRVLNDERSAIRS